MYLTHWKSLSDAECDKHNINLTIDKRILIEIQFEYIPIRPLSRSILWQFFLCETSTWSNREFLIGRYQGIYLNRILQIIYLPRGWVNIETNQEEGVGTIDRVIMGAGKNRIASKRSRSWRCHVDASAASLRLRWQSAKFFLKVHAMMKWKWNDNDGRKKTKWLMNWWINKYFIKIRGFKLLILRVNIAGRVLKNSHASLKVVWLTPR